MTQHHFDWTPEMLESYIGACLRLGTFCGRVGISWEPMVPVIVALAMGYNRIAEDAANNSAYILAA